MQTSLTSFGLNFLKNRLATVLRDSCASSSESARSLEISCSMSRVLRPLDEGTYMSTETGAKFSFAAWAARSGRALSIFLDTEVVGPSHINHIELSFCDVEISNLLSALVRSEVSSPK